MKVGAGGGKWKNWTKLQTELIDFNDPPQIFENFRGRIEKNASISRNK